MHKPVNSETSATRTTTDGIVPLYMVSSSVNLLGAMGFDTQQLLQGTSIDLSQLNVDRSCSQIVPFADLITVFDKAISLSAEADLGLQMGRAGNLGAYGVLGYAMMCSATDFEAVNLALKYQKIILGSHVSISMVIEHDRGVVKVADSLPDNRTRIFYMEQLLSGFLGFNHSLLGQDNHLLEIHFDYDDPGYKQTYEDAFGCSVYFNAYFTGIVFDTFVLSRPLPNADAVTAAACEAICMELLQMFDKEKVLTSEIKRLMKSRWAEQPGMEKVSQWLGCDVRTLRRKLQLEDTSFRVLKNNVRKDIAIDHLRNSQYSIQEIAALTGYGDTSSFRKAFHKWTGNYPGYYRY